MRLAAALLLCAVAALCQPGGDDPILRAMRDEMARSRQLGVVDDKPYYIEYAIDDAELYSLSATLGGLFNERRNRLRIPRIQVRVGDYAFDNTNHVFSDVYTGSRYDPAQFPLDNNYDTLRYSLWLATDRAYKQAAEAIARKRAALKNITVTEKVPDFAKAPPVKLIQPAARVPVDGNAWKTRLRELSAIFAGYPEILQSLVDFEVSQTNSYVVNNEGSEIRYPDRVAFLRVRAHALAPDGMIVRDHAEVVTLEPERMPGDAELRRTVTEVAANVQALARAPVGESYSGPVLLEARAAAQWFAELLGRNLSLPRRPVSDPNRPFPFPSSELEGRIGSRILPEWMDVVDDPTQKEYRGAALFGFYLVDMEGVAPQPVAVVEKGTLKNFLLTRQPVKEYAASNGRARLPGGFGAKQAAISNLFVKAAQTTAAAGLKQRLLEMAKQRSKPYALAVRKTDFPSSGSIDELRRLAASAGTANKPVSAPLLVYRVYPDGREELVRGLRFRSVTLRTLRDIVAASDEEALFHYMENGAPFALMGGGNYLAGCTVAAPALLFEDLDLERVQDEQPKLPLVPPPPLKPAK